MTSVRARNTPHLEAAFLRAEGRFAVMVGAISMAIGLVVALVLTGMSMAGGISSWMPAIASFGPVLLGWAALSYGAWRFEQAQAVVRGRRPKKLYLATSVQGVARVLRPKSRRGTSNRETRGTA
jgi:hypothetical protein